MAPEPHIVVGVDGSKDSRHALEVAAEEASLRRGHLEVLWAWAHIDPPSPPWEVRFDPYDAQVWAQEHLEELVADADLPTGLRVVPRAVNDEPAAALIEAGERADVLVVGGRGVGGFSRLLLGSVSHKVVTHAPCPVMVIRGTPWKADGRPQIVVGVDGSEPSRQALRWALAEAQRRGASLLAVHGWSPPAALGGTFPSAYPPMDVFEKGARLLVDAELDRAREEAPGVEVGGRSVCASGAGAVLDAARDASLVVVGSRGRGGVKRLLLGSVSQQVLQHADCSVTVVPDR